MVEQRIGFGEIVQEELLLQPPVSYLGIHGKEDKRLGLRPH